MDNISYHAVIRYLGLKGLAPKVIHEDMAVILGENAPSYTMVMTCAAEIKRSLEDNPRPGRPVIFTTQETIAKIHDIMADRRITEYYIATELGIS